MEEAPSRNPSLRERRPFRAFLREKFDFLFHWESLFYFGLFSFLLVFFWTFYSLYENSFTQLLNWDYTWQNVPFAYTFYDAWHTFFATGHFPLYDTSTWMGTDNLGSNNWFGITDPFTFLLIFFPRNWIPQMFVVITGVKLMVATLLGRAYLRYMGIEEWTARFGGLAIGYSGYMVFMDGFPSFVSAITWIPLVLLGLERVIQEKKPTVLIVGLLLTGLSSFFFLVITCVFGVIYALWRYFWSIKTRSKKDNLIVAIMGVAAFAVGLMLSAFTLIPSVRESALSGRSASIGTAYLEAIKTSLKAHDLRSFFALMFDMVGEHPGRELMGLLSFFYPSTSHIALPLARSGYDAWTASIFVYTPCLICFFTALLHSFLKRRWDHILAVLGGGFLVFTNPAYFLFFAFSGNGYGRWMYVLIPVIVYYGCWGFDQRKPKEEGEPQSPRWIPFAASMLTLIGTVSAFFIADKVLKGVNFGAEGYNLNHYTYWRTSYTAPTESYDGLPGYVYLIYQAFWVLLEGSFLVVFYRKEWLPKVFVLCVAVEIVVAGNAYYFYDGLWSYEHSFAGGMENRETTSYIASRINQDHSYFKTHSDLYHGSKYAHRLAGLKTAAEFHSLMNFETEDYCLMNQMKTTGGGVFTSYGTRGLYNPSWSGYYGNKRMGVDFTLGYRYYIINSGYGAWKNEDGSVFFPTPNVPFDSVELEEASPDRARYRVYRAPEETVPELGWGVNSNRLYYLVHKPNSPYFTNFYGNGTQERAFLETRRIEEVELYGATLDENILVKPNAAISQTEADEINANISSSAPALAYGSSLALGSGLKCEIFEVGDGNLMMPSTRHEYGDQGPGYFVEHNIGKRSFSGKALTQRDTNIIAYSSTEGEFLNSSYEGGYLDFMWYNAAYEYQSTDPRSKLVPRFYLIGDTQDENGMVHQNQLLSFEYNAPKNALDADGNKTYLNSHRSTFGMFFKGKAKYFCLSFTSPASGATRDMQFDSNTLKIYLQDYPDIRAKLDSIQQKKFQNVKTYTNYFTFDTAYSKPEIAVTQLGFDKGWQAVATMPNGKKINCQMIKLDGGLVGFVAPYALNDALEPQTIHYELRYSTPYSNTSALLWAAGMAIYLTYLGYSFYRQVKKQKELGAIETEEKAS